MLWAVADVDTWPIDRVETRGRRAKAWVLEPGTQQLWLGKTPLARAQAEAAIEHTVLQLSRAVGLPTANSRPATWGTNKGIVVESFVQPGETLESGANVIRGHASAVLDDSPKGRAAHTIESALASLKARDPALCDRLVDILLFDAWVGNGDRHSENWSILTKVGAAVTLAPIYDMSSCLGSGLQDSHRLLNGLEKHDAEFFMRGCPSGFGDGENLVKMDEVVERLAKISAWQGSVKAWLPRFRQAIESGSVDNYLARVPEEWLSSPRKQLAATLLKERLLWLEQYK